MLSHQHFLQFIAQLMAQLMLLMLFPQHTVLLMSLFMSLLMDQPMVPLMDQLMDQPMDQLMDQPMVLLMDQRMDQFIIQQRHPSLTMYPIMKQNQDMECLSLWSITYLIMITQIMEQQSHITLLM